MKKIVGIIYLLFFICFSSLSQQGLDGDALTKELETYKKQDKHRVMLLLDYCFYLESLNNDTAIEQLGLLKEALIIAKKNELKNETGAALCLIGSNYFSLSMIDSALFATLEGVRIYEKYNFEPGLLIAYSTLSDIYNHLEHFEKALEANKKCLKIIEDDTLIFEHARVYYYAAQSYESLKKNKLAEKYYLRSLNVCEKFRYEVGISICESGLGRVYSAQGELDKALRFLLKSYDFSGKNESTRDLASTSKSLGNLYYKIENYTEAIFYFSKAIEVYKDLEDNNSMQHLYTQLSDSYEKTEDFKKSLLNHRLASRIKDSLFNIEKAKSIDELLTKYETEKIQLEKDKAEERAEYADYKSEQRTQLSVIAVFVALLVTVLLVIIVNRLKLVRKQKVQLDKTFELMKEKTKIELAGLRIDALKAQMNPHFIFNSLNSIQDSIRQDDVKATYDHIALFAEAIRGTLDYSMSEFVDIDREVELLRVYLKLEQLRFGDDFNYSIELNGINQVEIPTFVVQPFIENALIHGLFHKKGPKQLSITFEMNGSLTCTIVDNGVGRVKSSEISNRRGSSHNSIATNNIETRLKLLSELYQKQFKCEIHDLISNDTPTGTKVVLTVPYTEAF